jgi:hypothetical protein
MPMCRQEKGTQMRKFCYALIVALVVSMLAAMPAQAADPKSCKGVDKSQHRKQCNQYNGFAIYSGAVDKGYLPNPLP